MSELQALNIDCHSLIQAHFSEHLQLIADVSRLHADVIQRAASLISSSLTKGGTIFWCGNGGSAADSQHLAAELVGRFKNDRIPLRSLALTTDTSVITCISNDYDFDQIFARQIKALARSGDVLVSMSTSGNSPNVLHAIKAATSLGVYNVTLLGNDGGQAKALSQLPIVVPSHSTARIQEVHGLMGHIFCDLIEREMGLV